MHFKGQLLLPEDDGPGLPVNLDLAEYHLAVESDDGGLGAWPLEVVEVERLEGDSFALTVAGEPLRFVAADAVAFTYSAIPVIEQVARRSRARSGFRSLLDRFWSAPDKLEDEIDEEPDAPVARHARDAEPLPAHDDSATQVETAEEVIDRSDRLEEELAAPEAVVDSTPEVRELAPPVDESGEPRCPAARGDGQRCESTILTSSGYCYPHDPRRAFDDKYEAAMEARAQMRREATGRLNRVYGRLDKAFRQVERGELDPETAMAMAQLARTMCAILDVETHSPRKDER